MLFRSGGSASFTEGSTTANEITGITTTPTNIVVGEFGEFLKIGQLYEYASVSTTRERLVKRLRDGAAVSIDSYTRSFGMTSTNTLYATAVQTGGQTTVTTTTALSASTIVQARKILFAGLATGFTGIPGHPDEQMAAVLTPLQELDVVSEVTTSRLYWSNAVVNVQGPMGQEKFVKGYLGSIYATACYVTNNFTTSLNTVANQIGFVYGDGGIASLNYGEMAPSVIINDVNSPYKNVNSIAWHCYHGAGLISSVRVVKLYSTGS